MTRDKIIEGLKSILAQDIYWEDDVAVMQEAITALQAQDVDAVSRQAVMWMLTNIKYTHCGTAGQADVIDTAKTMVNVMPSVQSVQPEQMPESYIKAVWTWLLDYQIKAAELKGKYTPYEVLSWVANDWRKEHE